MREWFQNLKDRLLGRKMQSATEENDMMNLNKAELQDRVRNSGGFFVDLSKLRFDPKFDIGFRIGRWYFIRIGDSFDNDFGYNESNEWDMSVSRSPDQSTHQLSKNEWSTYANDQILETTSSLPLTTETELLTEEATTENDVIESSTTEVFKSEEDNETGFEFDSGSVQVILP